MTAVIYARYSSDNQREESIEGQIRECTAYAEKNGITVIKHYIDRALSAKTDNRPDFQQMIKDSEKRLFDIVLVWKLDRFARNRYDSAHYEYQLERNHVKLVSATEPISDSPAGIMVKSMLTGMAEYYSAELSEKVVRGMTFSESSEGQVQRRHDSHWLQGGRGEVLSNRPAESPLCGGSLSAVQRWCDHEGADELAERQWCDHQPQPEVHLQQCPEAADEQTVHRRKPLQGHRNARQHPGHRGQGLV